LDSEKFHDTLETTKRFASEPRIVAGVQPYRVYHEELVMPNRLERLRGKKIVWIPGMSIDRADDNPTYIGVDYASERNRLTDEILLAHRDLMDQTGWDLFDDVHYAQVNPHCLLFFHVTPDGTLENSLEEVISATNRRIKGFFGNTTKNIDNPSFNQGILQYNDSVINLKVAKKVYGKTMLAWYRRLVDGEGIANEKLAHLERTLGSLDKVTRKDIEKHLARDVRFNTNLPAAAISGIADHLNLEELVCYMTKTGPEMQIMHKVSALTGIPVDDWDGGVMRNAPSGSVLREADPSAINLLKGRLNYWHGETLGRIPPKLKSSRRIVRHEPGFDLPEVCPELGCMRCPFAGQKRRDKERLEVDSSYVPVVDKCACDFAKNDFTMDDVKEIVLAKYGSNPLITPEALYDELRFKDVKYVDEKGEIKVANTIDILLQDNNEQGWTFADIVEDFRLLQHVDGTIVHVCGENYNTRSWKSFLGDDKLFKRMGINGDVREIAPLVIPVEKPDHYSIRPSEFSSACPISRILSKVDPSKLDEEILDHKWGLAGTARHNLALYRPWLDYMGRDLSPVPMWDFTEREVWTSFRNTDWSKGEMKEIKVYGHLDCGAQITNGSEFMPMILDYKRSPNEKQSYTVQKMIYLRAARRALGIPNGEGVIMLVNRPHFGDLGEKKFPIYHFAHVDEHSEELVKFKETDIWNDGKKFEIQGLNELVVKNYKMQHAIAASKDSYLAHVQQCCSPGNVCHNKENPGTCGHPFNAQMCNSVRERVEKGKSVSDFLYDSIVL
jgi:hypothetical protein